MIHRPKINALSVAVLLSLFYYFGPGDFAAFIFSVFVHELGHICGILLFSGSIKNLSLEAGGFSMSGTGITNRLGEFVSIISGPLFGFALAILSAKFTEFYAVSRISLCLSVYNMLPALPLDGGRLMDFLLATSIDCKKRENILEISGVLSGISAILLGAHHSQLILVGGGAWLLIAQTGIVKNRRVL